jgi:crossover junction endodeoxyribonuclease RuvC
VRICGIDPGIRGGAAIIEIVDGAAPQLVDAIDIPTIGTGAKERIDAIGMRTWISTHRPDCAAIERAGSMPKQGVASAFKFGRATGSLETVIACCNVPMTVIEPATWKRAFHLHGKDKEGARLLVLQRFPDAHVLFALKRHHNRAEAALIALHVSGGANAAAA